MRDTLPNIAELERDYLLGDVLGTGGMGVVYSAIQRALGRRVAIKIPYPELANDPAVIARFRTEARASGQLVHPNIARVIHFGGDDGALFLVMHHVAGKPLDKLVVETGPLAPGVAVELCTQVLAALGEAHAAGIIHADVKTANVLVERLAGEALRAVVIDFGLARFIDEPSTHDAQMISGTPEYLAPELIRGEPATVASDIYSTGMLLYELLTGSTPFAGGTNSEIFDRQLGDAVVLPSLRCQDYEIATALEEVVMRALAKDPGARFASASQFATALRAAKPRRVLRDRLARGTREAPFSVETPTNTWQRDPIPPLCGGVISPHRSVRLQGLRSSLKDALAGGDGDSIVTSYLELVRALIDGSQLQAATGELERGIALLRPGTSSTRTPDAMWRLQLCLAALYSGLGDPAGAKRAAIVGHEDAQRAASTLGEDRAHELLVRLARHGKPPHRA